MIPHFREISNIEFPVLSINLALTEKIDQWKRNVSIPEEGSYPINYLPNH
jgi:hypothetical protein